MRLAHFAPRAALALGLAMASAAPAAAQPITFKDLLGRERPGTDIRIPYGTLPDQFGELWLPDGPGPHPTVVMVHGGCWLASLPGVELMAYISEDLRRRGIAVWNVEYRRLGTPGAGYPGTFLDVAAAVDHLREVAKAHPLDLSRLVGVGHSAGGHLALWAGARPVIGTESPLHTPDPLKLKGVLTLAGINDLEAYRAEGPDACGGPDTIDGLTGAKERPGADLYADTSPAAMTPLQIDQIIVSGELDHIVPPAFGRNYRDKAEAAGEMVTVLEYPGAGHFELIDPTSAAWADISRQITALLEGEAGRP